MTAAVRVTAWPAGKLLGHRAVGLVERFVGFITTQREAAGGRVFDIETATDLVQNVSEFDCRPEYPAGVVAPAGAPAAALRDRAGGPVVTDAVIVMTTRPRPVGAPATIDVDALARMVVDGEIASASLGRDVVVLLAGRVLALKTLGGRAIKGGEGGKS